MTWVCRAASALLACFLVVLLGSAAQAATPLPAPSLTPGQTLTVTGWSCSPETVTNPDGSVTTLETCGATSYAVQEPAPAGTAAPPPAVQDVRVVAPDPLPVTEVNPSGSQTTLTCAASAEPEPSPSPDPSPSPSPASAEPSTEPCQVSLVSEQWSQVELAAGVLVFLTAAGSAMAWRGGRG